MPPKCAAACVPPSTVLEPKGPPGVRHFRAHPPPPLCERARSWVITALTRAEPCRPCRLVHFYKVISPFRPAAEAEAFYAQAQTDPFGGRQVGGCCLVAEFAPTPLALSLAGRALPRPRFAYHHPAPKSRAPSKWILEKPRPLPVPPPRRLAHAHAHAHAPIGPLHVIQLQKPAGHGDRR